MEIIGYLLAVLVGITLGLVGSGGSILTVPILVYIMGVDAVLATAYSLFIVGLTSLLGGIKYALRKEVHIKTALIFGLPSILSVYATRKWILPAIPDPILRVSEFAISKSVALMLLFAVMMILAAISMLLRPTKDLVGDGPKKPSNYFFILLEGLAVGLFTGLLGAGGGFLIIPALIIFAGLSMKLAVGTSLLIIAAKSLTGFLGDLQGDFSISWSLLLGFTLAACIGILIGTILSAQIAGEKLKKIFGGLLLLMGFYILVWEILGL